MRARVPQDQPEFVYDIAYYSTHAAWQVWSPACKSEPIWHLQERDTRRAGMLVGGTNQYHKVTSVVNLSEPDTALQVSVMQLVMPGQRSLLAAALT